MFSGALFFMLPSEALFAWNDFAGTKNELDEKEKSFFGELLPCKIQSLYYSSYHRVCIAEYGQTREKDS